ncbi:MULTISPECIES: hypothetical protein [Parafrankia]|uniref:Uncharacterized protein n=1 Tax=Parafrankia soli TaxID=2599596 RepID=A0A1S1PW61_9ACTN|nr:MULTISPECIES: hypothetical protein [Parafrankia]OHV25175.1 hypothetical protein BBK14_22320 [Parafrankia soli]TCJ40156.1 hypothetical protein E0504_06440 [Parafrankia sp. BMG5.11]SQD96988.1 conserved hypothetical protein [Parafrankia sp. Ea1.12]
MNDSAGRHGGPGHGERDEPGHDGHDDYEVQPGGMLGLRVLPAGWMRGVLGTVTALVTLVIAMGDLASAWVLLVLPATVAALVAYAENLERVLGPAADPED